MLRGVSRGGNVDLMEVCSSIRSLVLKRCMLDVWEAQSLVRLETVRGHRALEWAAYFSFRFISQPFLGHSLWDDIAQV